MTRECIFPAGIKRNGNIAGKHISLDLLSNSCDTDGGQKFFQSIGCKIFVVLDSMETFMLIFCAHLLLLEGLILIFEV